MKRIRIAVIAFFAVAMALLKVSSAEAGPMVLRLSDGTTTIDLFSASSPIVYIGAVGAEWTVNVTTGLDLATNAPHLHLNSVDVNAGGASTLTIMLTKDDYTSPVSEFALSFGGVLSSPSGSTATFDAFLDNSNANFGTASLIGTIGPLGPGAFAGTTSGTVSAGATYSLTQRVTMAFTGGGVGSFDADMQPVHAVPEPSTVMLLGTALVGLGVLRLTVSSRR